MDAMIEINLQKLIHDLIKKSGENGIKAKDISKALNIPKSDINSCLYSTAFNNILWHQDKTTYIWYLNNLDKKTKINQVSMENVSNNINTIDKISSKAFKMFNTKINNIKISISDPNNQYKIIKIYTKTQIDFLIFSINKFLKYNFEKINSSEVSLENYLESKKKLSQHIRDYENKMKTFDQSEKIETVSIGQLEKGKFKRGIKEGNIYKIKFKTEDGDSEPVDLLKKMESILIDDNQKKKNNGEIINIKILSDNDINTLKSEIDQQNKYLTNEIKSLSDMVTKFEVDVPGPDERTKCHSYKKRIIGCQVRLENVIASQKSLNIIKTEDEYHIQKNIIKSLADDISTLRHEIRNFVESFVYIKDAKRIMADMKKKVANLKVKDEALPINFRKKIQIELNNSTFPPQ